MNWIWLLAFLLLLVANFGVFLLLEAIALQRKDDDLHTLSTYIKRARRRYRTPGGVLLTLVIWTPAAWLWGHLVMEWW